MMTSSTTHRMLPSDDSSSSVTAPKDDVRKLGGRLVPGMSALAEIRLNQSAAPAAAH